MSTCFKKLYTGTIFGHRTDECQLILGSISGKPQAKALISEILLTYETSIHCLINSGHLLILVITHVFSILHHFSDHYHVYVFNLI